MKAKSAITGLPGFILIWFGELISLIGSGVTSFALSVWVYEQQRSVTQFAFVYVIAKLPGIVVLPLAGSLADRWDRRWTLILSDSGAALSTLSVALLLLTGNLEIWHVYIAVGLNSTFSAFQWPAYTAATTLLVPKKHLARASGMVQAAESLAYLLSPVLAGILLVTVKFQGVVIIDFMTFLFALVALLIVRIPKAEASAEGEKVKSSLLNDAAYGWTYIFARSGLLTLLIFIAAINFSISVVQVLIPPLVLSFSSAAVLGTILTVGGSGMLLGSLLISVWGGPKRRIYGIIGFGLLQGIILIVGGLKIDALVIGATLFILLFSVPLIAGCSQVIWQTKVEPDVQGRVFAARRMIAWSSAPIAYAVAGPLADHVFEPLVAEGGLLAGSLNFIIGTGPSRGIGLMFVVLGLLTSLLALSLYFYRPFKLVEQELPDVLDNESLLKQSV